MARETNPREPSQPAEPAGGADTPSDGPRPLDDAASTFEDLGRYAGLGLTLAVTLTLFAGGGYWLDERFGTLPLFLLLGVLVGGIGGTLSLVRHVPGVRRRERPRP